MASDSQLLTDILAELKAIRKALESRPTQAPGAAPGPSSASDPTIPFGRSKGKRLSEVDAREWEYFAALPVRVDKEGKPYPPTLQNAALRLLGRPPLSTKHVDNAPDEPKQHKPAGMYEEEGPAHAPDANAEVEEDAPPF